jgi:hypothetical protein
MMPQCKNEHRGQVHHELTYKARQNNNGKKGASVVIVPLIPARILLRLPFAQMWVRLFFHSPVQRSGVYFQLQR